MFLCSLPKYSVDESKYAIMRSVLTIFILPEAVFKEKRGLLNPMVKLTITSPYLVVNSEVQRPDS